MSKFKKISIYILTFILLITLSGCSTKDESLDHVTIAEVTHSVFYAPQYVAIEKGFFEEEGISTELLGAYGADKTMAALLSKEADIGLMGPEASIYVYSQGSDNYAISFAQITKRDGTFLISRKDEPNFQFSDLEGKEVIGGRKGGMPEMTLEYVLKNNGLSIGTLNESDVNVRTDIQFAVMAGAFSGGEGDYVTLFEPMATSIVNEGLGYIVASIGTESGEIPYTAYCALSDYIDNNSDLIQRFTNAVYRGQQFVENSTADEIAKIINPHFKELNYEELVTVIQRYKDNDTWSQNPLLEEDSLNRLMNVMELAGELKSRVPYGEVVNPNFALNSMK